MLVLRVFVIALAILCSVVGASSTHQRKACIKPAVRKEWRALNTREKAEWIRAVNVRELTAPIFVLSIGLTLVLVTFAARPCFDPDRGSFNITHSANQRIGLLLRWYVVVVGITNIVRHINFSTDIVYIHMDLNTRVRP